MILIDCNKLHTVKDIDGNVYQTIQIGNQVWMAENLKVTHYRNGTLIPNLTSRKDWVSTSSGAYCVYNNNDSNEVETYGALYNWYAVVDSNYIAPEGWHVPTDEEWKELGIFLGMSQDEADAGGWRGTNEGSKLAGNSDLWNSGKLENESTIDSSGFTALPGGYRHSNYGDYFKMGVSGYFWTTTTTNGNEAWYHNLYYDNAGITRSYFNKNYGFSVRCVRD